MSGAPFSRLARFIMIAWVLTELLAGCTTVNERLERAKGDLEQHGVEVHSGTVMRVLKF